MIQTLVNGQWSLLLPEHRANRPEWVTGWERERLDSMHANLQPGMTIVDVGAEEGDLSALYALWGCDVFLIEPNPRVWPNIRAIFEANQLTDRVAGWWVGFAGEVPDWPDLPDDPNVGRAWQDWPVCADGPVIGDHGFRHLSQELDVTPMRTIDELATGHRIDAITIDVEGSELIVLHGARRILFEQRPLVWVSVHTDDVWMDEQYERVGEADVDAYMAGFGYVATRLALDHELHKFYVPS